MKLRFTQLTIGRPGWILIGAATLVLAIGLFRAGLPFVLAVVVAPVSVLGAILWLDRREAKRGPRRARRRRR
jgi:hypothetical protein